MSFEDEFEIEEVETTPINKIVDEKENIEKKIEDNVEIEIEDTVISKNSDFEKLDDEDSKLLAKYGLNDKKKKNNNRLDDEDFELLDKYNVHVQDQSNNHIYVFLADRLYDTKTYIKLTYDKSKSYVSLSKTYLTNHFKDYQLSIIGICVAIVMLVAIVRYIRITTFDNQKNKLLNSLKQDRTDKTEYLSKIHSKIKKIIEINKFKINTKNKKDIQLIKIALKNINIDIEKTIKTQYPGLSLYVKPKKYIKQAIIKNLTENIDDIYNLSLQYQKKQKLSLAILDKTLIFEEQNTIISMYLITLRYRLKYLNIQFPANKGYIKIKNVSAIFKNEEFLRENKQSLKKMRLLFIENKFKEALNIKNIKSIKTYINDLKQLNSRIITIFRICKDIKNGNLATKKCFLFLDKYESLVLGIKKSLRVLPLLISKITEIKNIKISKSIKDRKDIFYNKNILFKSLEEDFIRIKKYIGLKKHTMAISLMESFYTYDINDLYAYFIDFEKELDNIVTLSSKTEKMSEERAIVITKLSQIDILINKNIKNLKKCKKKLFFDKNIVHQYENKLNKISKANNGYNNKRLEVKQLLSEGNKFKVIAQALQLVTNINIVKITNISSDISNLYKNISMEVMLIKKKRLKQKRYKLASQKMNDSHKRFKEMDEAFNIVASKLTFLKKHTVISKKVLQKFLRLKKKQAKIINLMEDINALIITKDSNLALDKFKILDNISYDGDEIYDLYKIKKYILKKFEFLQLKIETNKYQKEYYSLSKLLKNRKRNMVRLLIKTKAIEKEYNYKYPTKDGYIPIYNNTKLIIYNSEQEIKEINSNLSLAQKAYTNNRFIVATQVLRPYKPDHMSNSKALVSLINLLKNNLIENEKIRLNPELKQKIYKIEDYRANPGIWYDKLLLHIHKFNIFKREKQLNRKESFLATKIDNIHLKMSKYPDDLGEIFILLDKIRIKNINIKQELNLALKNYQTLRQKEQAQSAIKFLAKKTIEIKVNFDKIDDIKGTLKFAQKVNKIFEERILKLKSIFLNIENK